MAKIETAPFDAARYLTDSQSQAELLTDALASGEARYITHALRTVARARGLMDVAERVGGTREDLHDADPRISTLLDVAEALGMTLSLAPHATPSR